MACVDRHGAYGLMLTLVMFFNTVNGSAQTKVSCGESGGVVGQSQVLSCNISGSIENDIHWYSYNETYHEYIIICFKTPGGDVGACLPLEPSLYYVSSPPQQPKQQVFTIMSVTQEDLQVSWLCVDNNSFPERASIQAESTCRLDEKTTTILPTTTTEETTTILPNTNTKGQTYSLSGSAPYGIRGEDYRFTCQISGGNLPQGVEFKTDDSPSAICTLLLVGGRCDLQPSPDTRYSCGCINGDRRSFFFNITNVKSTDATDWTCTDLNENGVSSQPVTLLVYYGPENIRFTRTSSSITVIENRSRNVTCSADCNPPCNINWYKGADTSGTIISSSNGLLQLNNIQRQDRAKTCQAKHNTLTTAPLTKTLQITVYYGPENIRFTPPSSSVTVIENESRIVTCSADCNPPCDISWYKDSTIISSTELLSLNNIQRQQAGNYTCQVTNTQIPDSLQSKQLMVIVHYPATITSLTSDATNNTIDEDSTVTFTCSVDNLPSSVISWYRSQQGEQLYSGSQYTIPKASCQHTDNYTCTVSDTIGQTVSKTIPLYVRCSPRERIETKRNITNRVDATINLEVDIIAYPPPIFTWYHTPTRQIINTATTHQLSTVNYKSTVEITLNSTLFGDYIVSVYNDIGVQNFTITVIDGEPPKPVPDPVESNNIPTIVGSIIGVLIVIGIVVVIGVVIYRRKAARNDDNTYDGLGVTSLSTNQPVYNEINSPTTRSNDTTARADSTPAYYNTANMNHSDITNPRYVNSPSSTSTYDGPAHYNTTNMNHSDTTNLQYVNSPTSSSTYEGLDARSKEQHPDTYQLSTSTTPYEGLDRWSTEEHPHTYQQLNIYENQKL